MAVLYCFVLSALFRPTIAKMLFCFKGVLTCTDAPDTMMEAKVGVFLQVWLVSRHITTSFTNVSNIDVYSLTDVEEGEKEPVGALSKETTYSFFDIFKKKLKF